ncbi:MADS-box transcription factor [Parasponia andersonii]|uniref:MADS-box transcription factor n=1 Tax=Parasponia andersonii TaxID=3476 RepID=A0A2P5AGI0_PARAD|nr:MADS-box transcription factor [Parasponia andersonii]
MNGGALTSRGQEKSHITFSMCRDGLIKKARNLSVLFCYIDAALLIFSDQGHLYEFSNINDVELFDLKGTRMSIMRHIMTAAMK